jgi:4-hydroxyphenylacetate 3-monooxygenase
MALMTSEAYRAGLRDGRQVWIEGEKVSDVTRHAAFRPMIDAIGQIYDLHFHNAHEGCLTYAMPDGEPASRFYKLPTTPDDVRYRRLFTLAILNEVSPVIDRFGDETVTPLFVLTDRKALIDRFDPQYSRNVERWLSRLQRENLFMTSGNTDPKGNRSKQPYQQQDPDHYLRVVAERDDGIVVSGAKFETGASYAHVAFIKPTVGQWVPENRDYAVACVVPLNAPGLRHICRPPLSHGRSQFERPLSSRWDEIDTMLVFDNVLVPWEDVMFCRQPELANLIRQDLTRWAAQGFLLRSSVKADLLVGVACLVAEQTGLAGIPAVREKIAQLMTYAQAVKAFALAAEAECEPTESGLYMPNQAIQNAGRVFATSHYYEAVQILRDLAGGSAMMMPDLKTLRNKEVGQYVEKYFRVEDVHAESRIRTLHLVSELTSTLFAGRTQLYQMFAESPLSAQSAALYGTYDRKSAMARAIKLAGLEQHSGRV